MSKVLLIIVLVLFLSSCKKEKYCYMCQVIKNGIAHDEKRCGNADGHYVDDQGNDLQCIEIH